MAEVEVGTKEAQITQDTVSQFGPVMVTLEGMRTAGDRRPLPEAHGEINEEALVAWGPAMFMHPVEEREARVDAVQKALEVAVTVGMDPEAVKRLSQVILETRVDVFRRALTGEPAADMEPLGIVLMPDTSLERMRARPRQVAPEKMEWLGSQIQLLCHRNGSVEPARDLCKCDDGRSDGARIPDDDGLSGSQECPGEACSMTDARPRGLERPV